MAKNAIIAGFYLKRNIQHFSFYNFQKCCPFQYIIRCTICGFPLPIFPHYVANFDIKDLTFGKIYNSVYAVSDITLS